MNKIQINKFRMYGATDLVLDNYSDLFSQLSDLVSAHERLKSGNVLIAQNRQVQEVDNSGLTKSKTEMKANLIQRILQFSGALKAYATPINDVVLKTKVNYVASDLKKKSDIVLFDIGVLLRSLADPFRTDLAKFSLGDNEFAGFDNLLADFKLAIPLHRVAVSVSKVSTLNIGDAFDVQDKLLKNEIDVFMLSFKFTQPDFYNTYKNARSIVDYLGRGKATIPTPVPTPATTIVPAA